MSKLPCGCNSDSGCQGHTQRQMPRYKCHKEVWALKIIALDLVCESDEGGMVCGQPESAHTKEAAASDVGMDHNYLAGAWLITPAEEGYAPFIVEAEYVRKHNPQAGDYYVVYSDGYKSFSPAAAFEEGYTRVLP